MVGIVEYVVLLILHFLFPDFVIAYPKNLH